MLERAIKTIWKWAAFAAWLCWFLATLPWQLRKGYAQFIAATTFTQAGASKGVRYPVPSTYLDNLN